MTPLLILILFCKNATESGLISVITEVITTTQTPLTYSREHSISAAAEQQLNSSLIGAVSQVILNESLKL